MAAIFFQDRFNRRDAVLLAAVMNIVIIGLAFWELIPDKYGLPYDSAVYGDIARRFARYHFRIRLDAYYMQRLFPSAIVGTGLTLLQIKITTASLVAAFRILDLLAINIAFALIAKVFDQSGVDGRAKITGLVLCFCNFCFLKFVLYYPALTDCTAFAIAAGMLYAYHNERFTLLLVLGVLGAFTHPLLVYVAALLYLFPKPESELPITTRPMRWLRWTPQIVACGYALAGLGFYMFGYDYLVWRETLGTAPINMELYLLSVAVAALYLFAILRLAVDLRLPWRLIAGLRTNRLLPVLLLIAALKLFQHWRSTGAGRLDLTTYGINTIMASATLPAQFLVAHITFFGPAVLLVLLLYKEFKEALRHLGTGFAAVLVALLLLSVNSESRQYVICVPFLMLPLAIELQKLRITGRELAVLLIMALLISKVWLPINYAPPEKMRLIPGLNQRLFLNIGPWMLWQSYLTQAGFFLVCGLALHFLFRRSRSREAG